MIFPHTFPILTISIVKKLTITKFYFVPCAFLAAEFREKDLTLKPPMKCNRQEKAQTAFFFFPRICTIVLGKMK